jgi:ABC-2 type transport system ATP-binding protein
MGHDVVNVSLNGADIGATEAALAGLAGLERVVAEVDALALYVQDGASSIAEIVRRLDRDRITVGAISVSRPTLDDVFLEATGRRLEGDQKVNQAEVSNP